jgi:predicted transcriptional regulator
MKSNARNDWTKSFRSSRGYKGARGAPFFLETLMKKIKNEAELVREAIRVGETYVQKRGVGAFEDSDSAHDKITYLYRLLVHDKLIQPLAKGQVSDPNLKHKLALWISRQLPTGHPLLS